MQKSILLILLLIGLKSYSQQTVYDVFTVNAPVGWTKGEEGKVYISYTTINQQTRSWCRFLVYKSTIGTGNLMTDFNKEWNDLVVKANNVTEAPVMSDSVVQNGWSTIAGSGQFVFESKPVVVMMSTFSANLRCASIIVMTNDLLAYQQDITTFMDAVELKEMMAPSSAPPVLETKTIAPVAISSGYQYNTSNFDDGWTSVVKEDWVEVVKGDIRVLLHYPREEEKKYIPQHDESTRFFWNLFVAPRYSNLRNFEMLSYSMSFEPAHFAGGFLRDNQTGQDVWVTVFQKAKSGWIEIITKDKQQFVNTFGINNPDSYFMDWEPLLKLAGYNKFAVGENDLPGKWSNDFSSSSSYYNVYTGIYSGSSTYASRVTFTFDKNKKYTWHLVMASGGTGTRTSVEQVNANGAYKHIGNWQLWFSDIEKKPKTYSAYFSCIKGGRILWLQDTGYGSYSSFGRVD